jgi:hypothetical protein
MAEGIARSDFEYAQIQSGRVIDVDPSTWMMTVRTEVGEKQAYNVPIPSLYTHPFEGEGMHIMPEIGAYVWLAMPSEGDVRAFPLLYKGLSNEAASHQAHRPNMNPGDIVMVTRDRNGMKIRRGGVVEMFSTPLSRMFFLPDSNRILTICENWEVLTLGGSLKWKTAREEEDPDLQKGTKLTLEAKEFANHPHPVATLQVGGQISDEADETQMLDLRVWQNSTIDVEEEGPLRESMSLTVGREGDLNLKTYQEANHALDAVGGGVLPSMEINLQKDEDVVSLEVFKDQSEDSSVKVTIDRDAHLKIQVAPGVNQVSFFSDELNTEGVILGKTHLAALQGSLQELSSLINALGLPTPITDQFLLDITASLTGPDGKGGPPFLSTTTRTD